MKEYIVPFKDEADFEVFDMRYVTREEVTRCKYCDWFDCAESWCTFHGIEIHNEERGFCCWAEPKPKEEKGNE